MNIVPPHVQRCSVDANLNEHEFEGRELETGVTKFKMMDPEAKLHCCDETKNDTCTNAIQQNDHRCPD